MATERAETFPYVFMKPATTTLNDPGKPVRIPRVSPGAIDWECELAVVIGRRTRGVSESEALGAVAGYTVINDFPIASSGQTRNERNERETHSSTGCTASGTTVPALADRVSLLPSRSPIRRNWT